MAVYTGEKPRKGTYKCLKCGNFISLDENTDRLPPCGKCHNNKFKKLVWPGLLYNLIIGHEDMTKQARKQAKLKAKNRRANKRA